MFNLFAEGSADDPFPVDYIPEQSGSTILFTNKEIKNVLDGVLSGYTNFGRMRQHDISLLVLQLDELMTLDEKTSNLVDGPHNTCLLVPIPMTRRHKPKN